jgi:hypothetical protein
MTAPLNREPGELAMEAILREAGIAYTRPELDAADPANFDFRLSDVGVYVECKRRLPGKLRKQMRRVTQETTVICLLGPNAARDLLRLSAVLARAGGAP